MALNEAIRNASVTIGTSAVDVCPPVDFGVVKVRTFTNTSTGGQVITLTWGQGNPTALSGIVLYPAGSCSESIDNAFVPSNVRVMGIASAAGATLAVHERVSYG